MMPLKKIWSTLPCLIFVITMGSGQNTAMTFNIRYDNPADSANAWNQRKPEVVELIRGYNPDFIGIQEALPKQVSYLSEHLEDHKFIGYGRDGLNTNSEASPIFYNSQKFELINHQQLWLSETPNEISRGWDAALNRILVYGAFRNKTSGTIFHVLNTHFDHQGVQARLHSAALIKDFILRENMRDQKIIVMGDMNAVAEDAPIQLLNEELTDSREVNDIEITGPEATFNNFDPDTPPKNRIDYIFIKNLEVKSYQCIDHKRTNGLYPSDHFPVFIAFYL